MITKCASGLPTIPVSNDHRDGSWIATDIYECEQYVNTDTGVEYTRLNGAIIRIGNIPNEDVIAKFRVYQQGGTAPTIIPYFNPYSYSLTPAYDGAGLYRVTGFTGQLFLDDNEKYEMYWSTNALLGGSTFDIYPSTDESVVLRAYDNTGSLSNNIIERYAGGTNAAWNVVTIVKYS
jgi:hypothetical protein